MHLPPARRTRPAPDAPAARTRCIAAHASPQDEEGDGFGGEEGVPAYPPASEGDDDDEFGGDDAEAGPPEGDEGEEEEEEEDAQPQKRKKM